LPPIKIEVRGCAECPLRHAVEGIDGDEESKCVHPDVPSRAVAHDATEPPGVLPAAAVAPARRAPRRSVVIRRLLCWLFHGERYACVDRRGVFYRCNSCDVEWARG
jgi:hypothetical protein